MAGQRIFRDLITTGRHKGKPKCVHEGCENPGQYLGNKRKDGSKIYRPSCTKHHYTKYGMNDWEYKRYRLTYCENKDGRLNFRCTATIPIEYAENMLDADHINNIHEDNRKANIQTLCAACHRVKTSLFGHLRDLGYIKKLLKNNAKKFAKNNKKVVDK